MRDRATLNNDKSLLYSSTLSKLVYEVKTFGDHSCACFERAEMVNNVYSHPETDIKCFLSHLTADLANPLVGKP